jgi:hypothetical protein
MDSERFSMFNGDAEGDEVQLVRRIVAISIIMVFFIFIVKPPII